MISAVFAGLRRARTWIAVRASKTNVVHGDGLHIGAGTRLWAPRSIKIGRQVYIGKDVHIEANCEIGDYSLIANRVAIVGRNDHDFHTVGVPVRFGTWIGSREEGDPIRAGMVVLEGDVWIGFGAILLTGVRVGRGAVVAAGSVVTKDVPEYALVAGAPARQVGVRFSDDETKRRHEDAIRTGRFAFSERGFKYWIVEPGRASE